MKHKPSKVTRAETERSLRTMAVIDARFEKLVGREAMDNAAHMQVAPQYRMVHDSFFNPHYDSYFRKVWVNGRLV